VVGCCSFIAEYSNERISVGNQLVSDLSYDINSVLSVLVFFHHWLGLGHIVIIPVFKDAGRTSGNCVVAGSLCCCWQSEQAFQWLAG